jgi:hypothetical protein
MRFWDASAIIPLCLSEPRTSRLKRLVQRDAAIAAWWMTPVECYSAFARLRRDAILTRTEEDQARHVLARLVGVWTEIEPSREIREAAARLLLLPPLRAADSLQLAAGLVWARGLAAGQAFVSLDQRLWDTAQLEGFQVVPEL